MYSSNNPSQSNFAQHVSLCEACIGAITSFLFNRNIRGMYVRCHDEILFSLTILWNLMECSATTAVKDFDREPR